MKLKEITIQGFKSFDEKGATIRFGDVTVLLGANGVGKSNVVSFFKMLNFMAAGAFQTYVAEQGFADAILHYGAKHTHHVFARIELDNDEAKFYEMTLNPSVDSLKIAKELVGRVNRDGESWKDHDAYGAGMESFLIGTTVSSFSGKNEVVDLVSNYLNTWKVFHFHDTASNSKIRSRSYIGDNHRLNHEAGNLAALLYAFKVNPAYQWHYARIVREIKQIMPQFGDFVLEPDKANPNYIALNWRENSNNPEYLFGPHQISDGSLRYIALATLLLQPKEMLPKVIVLDEPELGLHPTALAHLAGMIAVASEHCQVVIATQSPRFVDEFDVEEIVILERDPKRNATVVSYKTEEELAGWLERYSLSELWEKNVIGGLP